MVDYPVAIDNDYAVWRAFNNQYWPAHFFIDAKGQIRHHHFGEGEYEQSEKIIQQLLVEAGQSNVPTDIVDVDAAARWPAPISATCSRLRPMWAMAGRRISPRRAAR